MIIDDHIAVTYEDEKFRQWTIYFDAYITPHDERLSVTAVEVELHGINKSKTINVDEKVAEKYLGDLKEYFELDWRHGL